MNKVIQAGECRSRSFVLEKFFNSLEQMRLWSVWLDIDLLPVRSRVTPEHRLGPPPSFMTEWKKREESSFLLSCPFFCESTVHPLPTLRPEPSPNKIGHEVPQDLVFFIQIIGEQSSVCRSPVNLTE